jgi:hypothetical protein
MRRAQIAVVHSILVSADWMLTRDEAYHAWSDRTLLPGMQEV